AVDLFRRALPEGFATSAIEQVVGRGVIKQHITSYLLMSYIVDAVERDLKPEHDLNSFVKNLPATLDDIGRQRYVRLTKREREALFIAAALGYSFQLGALEAILRSRFESHSIAESIVSS